MTEAEKKMHYRIITGCWRLFQKYGSPVGSQEYWQNLNEDARAIVQKYGEQHFVKEQVFSVLNEIDRIWERRKVNDNKRRYLLCQGYGTVCRK